ncbi:hypothetical protein J5U21_01539 [Saccharolobus shibatae]|uniref:Uncharacterized protein n=2 Tax=Saccharolobus shibatae TaxID=2286 RepID=A0A8F5GW76_9CREN|nr:hypothetical protein J5U21_01539 [Saccharolobus shibatae]
MFTDFLGGKVPPKSIVFFFYKRLQQTVVSEGETMRTILMDELNKALDKVIKEYREKGFELEVGREKTIGSRLPHNRFFREAYPGKRSLQNGLEKISLDLKEMRFNDEFLLMGYTTSKLKYFTAFRKYKGVQ